MIKKPAAKFTARQPKPREAAVDPLKDPAQGSAGQAKKKAVPAKEIGGPSGPEPTRYGDWERKGICVDF